MWTGLSIIRTGLESGFSVNGVLFSGSNTRDTGTVEIILPKLSDFISY